MRREGPRPFSCHKAMPEGMVNPDYRGGTRGIPMTGCILILDPA